MRLLTKLFLPLIFAFLGLAAIAAPAHAAAYGVEDNGNLFSAGTVTKANSLIDDIRVGDNRDVLVVTYATIPADKMDGLKTKGKDQFYEEWADSIGKQNGVSGVVILLVKDPGRLQIVVGNKTRQRSFTMDDRKALNDKMLPFLKDKKYDDALLQGLEFVKDRMKRVQANAAAAPSGSNSTPGDARMSPNASNGTPNYTPPVVTPTGFPILGLICGGVAILAVVVIILNVVNRSRNNYSGGGYNSPPPGGYPPGYSGGYPQGGGGYGYGGVGGGGGFGRGLLGGLLGGALGAWGYEKFNQGSSTPNYNPPTSGGGNLGNSNDQTDTSYSGGGSDFGSSNDSANSGGGADFGSSSDSSSGGSDFGSGGDSGGGGDFGGGGDSGGSSGGDF